MKRIVYTIAMILILAGGAMAQSTFNSFSFGVSGIQTTEGTEDYVNNICWSNTFTSTGRDSQNFYNFTISIDYIDVEEGNDTDMIGGNWSLAVFKDKEHVGTLFGAISYGTITSERVEGGFIRHTYAKISITGGTGIYVGASGSGIARSTSGLDTPNINGTVKLNFSY